MADEELYQHCMMCNSVEVPELGMSIPLAKFKELYSHDPTSGFCNSLSCRIQYAKSCILGNEVSFVRSACKKLKIPDETIESLINPAHDTLMPNEV